MDVAEITYIILGAWVLGMLFFLMGKIGDITFKAKILRMLFRRNYIILHVVSKDTRTIVQKLVNADKDTVEVDGNLWIVEKGHIYRENKEERGFFIKRSPLKWTESIPSIFVDGDNIKPIDFYEEEGTIKPDELSAVLSSWVSNQLAKGFRINQQQQTLILVTLVLVLICICLSVVNLVMVMDVKDSMLIAGTNEGQIIIPAGGRLENGELVIDQPRG